MIHSIDLTEADLEALDECVLRFAEDCDPGNPEELDLSRQASAAIEKLARAALDSGVYS